MRFGKLTIKQSEDLKTLLHKANDTKSAKTINGDYGSLNSIFNQKKYDGESNSVKNVATTLAGGADAFKELSESEIKQYVATAALMDGNNDGVIDENEYKSLVGKSGVNNTQQIDSTDIEKLMNEKIFSESSYNNLMTEINEILGDVSGTEEKVSDKKGISTKATGVQYNDETGEYSVNVEKFRSGKVQDDGEGGTRYPNGSYWGMVTNAYPEINEADKEKVYDMIGEMNGFDWQSHTLMPGDNLKLPILEYDENGRVTGYKKAEETEEKAETNEKESAEETTENAAKMVANRGYEAEYEIKNDDGSVTKFTVKAGQDPKPENASSVATEKVNDNGQLQRTVENDGVTKEYLYSGEKLDGKPVSIKTTNADGSYSVETRTYENGAVASKEVKEYDAQGNLIQNADKTAAKTETTPAKTEATDEEYAGWSEKLSSELKTAIENGDMKQIEDSFNRLLDGEALSDAQKSQMFLELLDQAAAAKTVNGNEAVEDLMAEFNNPYGSSDKNQVKLTNEQSADAIKVLLNNNNSKSDSWITGRIAPTMENLIAEGNIDKALELGNLMESKYNDSAYNYIDTNNFAQTLADKAIENYGEFSDKYGRTMATVRQNLSKDEDAALNKKLLDAAVSEYPDELEGVLENDKVSYEQTLEGKSTKEKIEYLLSDECKWDDSTKQYYLKKYASEAEIKNLKDTSLGFMAMYSASQED